MTQNFKAGDRVYSKLGATAGYKIFTVGKVHKNGNFTIGDGKQQYRPDGHACGDSSHRVSHLTDEKLVELEATKAAAERHRDFRFAADRFSRMGWGVPISRDNLDRMLCLVDEVLGK